MRKSVLIRAVSVAGCPLGGARSPNRGARLWAVRQLGMLFDQGDGRIEAALRHALDDSAALVREQARHSLGLED